MTADEKKDAFAEIALGRRSIRSFDERVDIPREEMMEMLEMATAAPSSSNMQPWRFAVVGRPQIKEKLLPHVQFNTGPVGTAAAVIAIYGDLESAANAEDIMRKTAEARGQRVDNIFPAPGPDDESAPPRPPAGTSPREMILDMLRSMPRAQRESIALIDCGLAAMQLMLAARALGYDTVPLGAYDRESVARALGMDEERYVPVMLLAVGRAAGPGMPPYRLPVSHVARFI